MPHPCGMLQDIVITGVGAVCALGKSRKQIVGNLRAGTRGVQLLEVAKGCSCYFGKAADCELPSGVTDRAAGFALEATAAALLDAEFPSTVPSDRIAILVSSSKGLLRDLILMCADKGQLGTNWTRWTGDQVGRLVASRYGFSGPILNFPAACASGSVSLIAGVHLLQDGVADVVIAGSTEDPGNPLMLAGFMKMDALDPEPSSPFHPRRRGFNPGEGAGVFVLEREDDARKRGATVLSHIRGWDFRCDAYHITGTDPTGAVLEHAIHATLRKAGWSASTVQYINAHGTGTAQNDEVESSVIRRVFGENGPPVSTLKPAIGHILGGSAAVELAAVIMCADDEFVPPTLSDKPCCLNGINYVPRSGLNRQCGRILKLSLGFGGHIAVVALEMP